MTNNLSILEKNLIDSFETTQAQEEFMWAARRADADKHLYIAEAYAREIDQLLSFVSPYAKVSAELHNLNEIPDGLIDFIVSRHRNKTFSKRG
jgi:hypothetical protein